MDLPDFADICGSTDLVVGAGGSGQFPDGLEEPDAGQVTAICAWYTRGLATHFSIDDTSAPLVWAIPNMRGEYCH